jgi:RNA polymerase sigma-70 factor (ECF subfamily)
MIVRNLTFNILKRCAYEKRITAELHRQSSVKDVSTENIILQHDYERILLEAVEKLPPQQKLIFKLSREQGLKRAEIARELNISPETVKAHMYSALKFIRSNFNLPEHAFTLFLIVGMI